MFDHILAVFASGHVGLLVFVLIIIFEIKYKFDFGEVLRRRIRVGTLVLTGVYFIVFHQHIVADDVFIDMRGVGVALATLFGGSMVGVITASAEILARIWIGGQAVLADSLGLVLDLILSLLVLHLFAKKQDRIRLTHVALAGVGVGIGEAVALLFIMPAEFGLSLFREFGLDLFVIQVLGTMMFGWLLKNQDDRMLGRAHGRVRVKKLYETMKLSVAALSTAMVHHDPTTHGHEQRVADLAVRVAQKLGLNADRVEGLQLAAIVHDVGQIRVPREILSRPRKLTAEEFELVKLHVEAGYSILKDVPFPWPVADIVRQHHENVDGTGYPNGLSGGQILLEAKILHVCDAVEAMTAHRPFRRAGTIEYALEELIRSRTTSYDAAAVDACVRLFREEGYRFPVVKQEEVL